MITGIRAIVLTVLATACQPSHMVNINMEEVSDKPELFAEGIVSTPLYERDLAVAPDGSEIVYSLGDYTQKCRSLVAVSREAGLWAKATILPFSGKYNDIEPFFAPDGNRLYFASNRPIDTIKAPQRRDYNIWYVQRDVSGWRQPVALDTVINTTGDEFYPAVCNNGSVYFTAQRETGPGREDIWVSRFLEGRYQPAVPLDTTVNSATYEFNAYVSPNEDIIIFSSYGRKDDMGGGDLYYSTRSNSGIWEMAKNMGPSINSDALDYCPFLDLPRNTFYFTSNRAAKIPGKMGSTDDINKYANSVLNGMGNIYRVRTQALNIPGLPHQ